MFLDCCRRQRADACHLALPVDPAIQQLNDAPAGKPVDPATQQLNDAPAGKYVCEYDSQRHHHKFIFESWDNPLDKDQIPYLKPDASGHGPLTKGDGSPIQIEEGDWLIPVLLRDQANREIHLLLPSNLVGDCRAHDTIELLYDNKSFTLSFAPEFRNRVLTVEMGIYGVTHGQPFICKYPMPSDKRAEARQKLLKESLPQMIAQMNQSENRFVFNKETKKLEKYDGQNPLVERIDSDRAKVITVDTLERPYQAPWVKRNHIGCYLYTTADKVAMAVCNGQLIIWQHSDLKLSEPKPKSDKVRKYDMYVPLNIDPKDIKPVDPLAHYPKDIFTIIPLNNETITEAEFLDHLAKVEFPNGSMFGMNLEN